MTPSDAPTHDAHWPLKVLAVQMGVFAVWTLMSTPALHSLLNGKPEPFILTFCAALFCASAFTAVVVTILNSAQGSAEKEGSAEPEGSAERQQNVTYTRHELKLNTTVLVLSFLMTIAMTAITIFTAPFTDALT